MIYTVLLAATSAALASAQATYNSTTGEFSCIGDGTAYCAGDSLATNIILRCTNGTAVPGNCNDNLSGYFPIGDDSATCYQTSETSGDAACAKNCIVEGGSGNSPTFTLPNCTPLSPSTSSSVPSSTSDAAVSAFASATGVSNATSTSSSITITSTGTATFVSAGTTITEIFTTTYCPGESTAVASTTPASTVSATPISTLVTAPSIPLSTGATTVPAANGTTTAPATTASGSASGSATKTPTAPTSSSPALPEANAAIANSAGLSLVFVGLIFAYFL